jgi:pyrroline-5-carboxylate reductase
MIEQVDKLLVIVEIAGMRAGDFNIILYNRQLTITGIRQRPDSEQALELVVQTVAGAAEMLRQGLGTPDELRQAVTSKGGTTAAGLQVMADADFRGLIAAVIRRATERSVELCKG